MNLSDKKYQIFSLHEAVSDVTRVEVVYDEWTFTLHKYFSHRANDKPIYDTEEEAVKSLEETLKDYNRRGIEDARFIILPVYFTNKDKLFNQQP